MNNNETGNRKERDEFSRDCDKLDKAMIVLKQYEPDWAVWLGVCTHIIATIIHAQSDRIAATKLVDECVTRHLNKLDKEGQCDCADGGD
jgi:hypothetical protein